MIMTYNIFFDVTKIDVITLCWKLGQWLLIGIEALNRIMIIYDIFLMQGMVSWQKHIVLKIGTMAAWDIVALKATNGSTGSSDWELGLQAEMNMIELKTVIR